MIVIHLRYKEALTHSLTHYTLVYSVLLFQIELKCNWKCYYQDNYKYLKSLKSLEIRVISIKSNDFEILYTIF